MSLPFLLVIGNEISREISRLIVCSSRLAGDDELVAFSVDVDDLYRFVLLEVLAELGDVHIHAAGIEEVVVEPDGLQGKLALKDLVGVGAEEREQLRLLRGELGLAIVDV